jgi:hypothetical protein
LYTFRKSSDLETIIWKWFSRKMNIT